MPHLFQTSVEGIGSVEYCIADAQRYKQTLKFYQQLFNEQGTREPDGTYSFDAGNTELRIAHKALPTNQVAILYFRLSGEDPEALKALHRELKNRYREVLAPRGNPHKDAKETWRSVLADDSGSQFGLVINPPYPRFHGKRWLPWLGSVLGLALGAGLASWLVSARRSRR